MRPITALRSIVILAALLACLTATGAQAADFHGGRQYVKMADGTELAVMVQVPQGYDGHTPMPAIFEYDGYDGGAQASFYSNVIGLGKDYITVHAGVRGTGCSGGEFSLFSQQQAQDGAQLVEWIARQDWSNGNVGIVGHSYSGEMGVLVAAQHPPHLRAVSVDGTLDDLYRDLVYPGGVANSGFPILWLAAARPAQEYPAEESNGGTDCWQHILQRDLLSVALAGKPQESPYLQGELGYEDDQWWRSVSPGTWVPRIEVPTQITGGSQDEQILGRSATVMFGHLEVADKQLLVTNGDHNSWWQTNDRNLIDRRHAWMDRFVRGVHNGIDKQPRVQYFLEGHRTSNGAQYTGVVSGDDYPLPQTGWTRFYASDGKTLSTTPPTTSGSDVYVSGTHRNEYDPGAVDSQNGSYTGQEVATADGPDQALFRSAAFDAPTTIAGPLEATIYASMTAPDTEFYVRVADEAPDGSLSLLTRGYLKASHRAIDPALSGITDGFMWRAWHPHTNTTTALVTPGQVTRYDIEVWPVGNVFRPGHRLVMIVSAPPLQEGYDTYQPRTVPTAVTIVHDADHPTNLLVPEVPTPKDLGPAVACGDEIAVKCAQPGQIPNFSAG